MREDPVCGTMFVGVREATVALRHRRQIYYFCSLRCRDVFMLTPRRFAVAAPRRIAKRPHRRRAAA